MTSTELRRQIEQCVDGLSPQRLQAAADFLRYLKDLESDDATEELLRIPAFSQDLENGLKALDEGRATPVEQLKRKY